MSKFVQLWALCHGFFIKTVKGCSPLIFTALYKQFKGECLAVIHLSPSHTYSTQKICDSLPSWPHSTFLSPLHPPHTPHTHTHTHTHHTLPSSCASKFLEKHVFYQHSMTAPLITLADEHNLVFEPAPQCIFFSSHKFKMGFHHVFFFVASRNLQEPVPPRWVFWSSLSSTD